MTTVQSINPACSPTLQAASPNLNSRLHRIAATAFKRLNLTMTHPGRVYCRQQIITGVDGPDRALTARSVIVQVVALRRKLARLADHSQTVRGVGCQFKVTD